MPPALGPLAPTADHTITSVERSTGAGTWYSHVDDNPASGQPDSDWLGLRAGTPFSPTNLTGLIGWFDASDTATITASAGAVSQWDDKSGNAYHLTQGTASNRPVTGTRTQNGMNVLDFISNDTLGRATTPTFDASTIVVVALLDTLPATSTLVSAFAAVYGVGFSGTGGDRSRINRGGTVATAAATSVVTATPYVLAYTNATGGGASSGNAWVNTTQTITAGSPGTTTAAGYRVGTNNGGTLGHDGWIAEVVLYDNVLGTTDRETVRDYLKTKWAVY